jgi:hypothetical protein
MCNGEAPKKASKKIRMKQCIEIKWRRRRHRRNGVAAAIIERYHGESGGMAAYVAAAKSCGEAAESSPARLKAVASD